MADPTQKELPPGCLIGVAIFAIACGLAPILAWLDWTGGLFRADKPSVAGLAGGALFVIFGLSLIGQAVWVRRGRPAIRSKLAWLGCGLVGTAMLFCFGLVSASAAAAAWNPGRQGEFSGAGSFLENKVVWTVAAALTNLLLLLILAGLWRKVIRGMRGKPPDPADVDC